MTNNELLTHAWRIVDEFAQSDTNTGSIGVTTGTIPSGSISIGTFVDTRRNDAPGTHPVESTSITSVTYNFYQYTSAVTEDFHRPVRWDSTLNGLQESDNSNIDNYLMTTAQAFLISTELYRGVGQYMMQPGTPPTSGTGPSDWTQVGTISNQILTWGGSINTNTTKLWKKHNMTGTFDNNVRRPVRMDHTATPSVLREMTDAEIRDLSKRFSNLIISSGIGTYRVQESAPAVAGTWVRKGIEFSDTINKIQGTGYTSYYSGDRTYAGNYTGNYTGTYSTNFAADTSYTGSYLGTTTVFYGGVWSQTVNQYFSGTYTGSFTGNFSGTYTGTYAGDRTYAGNYATTFSGGTVTSYAQTASNISLWMRIS